MKLLVLTGLLAFVNSAPSPQTLPQVPGLAEHQAAVNALLALQGLAPGNPAEARHAQAEAALVALQQQQAAQNAQNVAVVGPSGNIGPSGQVGASGNIGPSGLCGPSGCIAF